MKRKVLLVEDEISLAGLICENLEVEGYEVTTVHNGEDGLKVYHYKKPDIIILDVMMPKVNGLTVAKTIRTLDSITPIIFLTAKIQVKDVIKGFEAGANDYIRKPFSFEELLIRIKVLLGENRFSDKPDKDHLLYSIGSYRLDAHKMELALGQRVHKLTFKENELLKLFAQHQNEVLSKSVILYKIWGDDDFYNSRTLDVFISKLRKYLKDDPDLEIMNIRGIGYKLLI